MILPLFQAPSVGLREAETERETSLSATAAEVTSPAVDVKRLGEQIRLVVSGRIRTVRGPACTVRGSVAGERTMIFVTMLPYEADVLF